MGDVDNQLWKDVNDKMEADESADEDLDSDALVDGRSNECCSCCDHH